MGESAPLWITIGGGLVALYKYLQGQTWKRKEFVFQHFKAFQEDPAVATSLKALEWRERRMILSNGNTIKMDEDLLMFCLISDSYSNTLRFTDDEAVIRDDFSKFLDQLEQLDNMIESGIIAVDDLRPFLGYWLHIIGHKQNQMISNALRNQIWNFINDYGYEGVQKLMRRFDMDITQIDRELLLEKSMDLTFRRAGKSEEYQADFKSMIACASLNLTDDQMKSLAKEFRLKFSDVKEWREVLEKRAITLFVKPTKTIEYSLSLPRIEMARAGKFKILSSRRVRVKRYPN